MYDLLITCALRRYVLDGRCTQKRGRNNFICIAECAAIAVPVFGNRHVINRVRCTLTHWHHPASEPCGQKLRFCPICLTPSAVLYNLLIMCALRGNAKRGGAKERKLVRRASGTLSELRQEPADSEYFALRCRWLCECTHADRIRPWGAR